MRQRRTVAVGLLGLVTCLAPGCPSDGSSDAGHNTAADVRSDSSETDSGEADSGPPVDAEDGGGGRDGGTDADASTDSPIEVAFRDPRSLLPFAPGTPPATTDIHMVDLDGKGGRQMLITEANEKDVSWVHDCTTLTCSVKAKKLGQLNTPIRARDVDFDGDGDLDLIVPDVGGLMGAHEGAIVLLKNDGDQNFSTEMLMEKVGQVAWAEPTDMDGDGDPDVVVAIFTGTKKGLLWLEQTDDGSVKEHVVSEELGLTHVAHADFDGDGDRDLAGAFSETVEKVMLFENDGEQNFEAETLFEGPDSCWGLTGLWETDLDGDGHPDLLAVNGDAYDEGCATEERLARHGVDWLRNDGRGGFERHRIGSLEAAITAKPVDLDGDADLDVVLSSQWSARDFDPPAPPPMIWLENRGGTRFERHTIDNAPTGTVALEVTDWNEDGVPDLLTGSLRFKPDVDAERLGLILVEREERK